MNATLKASSKLFLKNNFFLSSMSNSISNSNSHQSPQLYLYNSLTQKKPLKDNTVTWYCCGPTVYDSAHMGHARSYISFDIIRRVLKNYFNYNIMYVMNITDIDDKIIVKARKEHLWHNFLANLPNIKELSNTIAKAIDEFEDKTHKTPDPDLKKVRYDRLSDAKSLFHTMNFEDIANVTEQSVNSFKEVLSDHLDNSFGRSVTDHGIFSKISQKYEKEFLEDMRSLNPTFLPRVSEYVSEIIDYIKIIIKNGFAYVFLLNSYESDGSVYFNTIAFSKSHVYAKLVPSAAQDLDSLAVGEGELSLTAPAHQKRSPRDFALWKASKDGEPFWNSPWGNGRPGWHIECSVMCGHIFPGTIDIHSGGVDLKFPHHDNEIAQSEAYYDSQKWVNFFLHTGHLTIGGCKMSKSLKNFVTIREALKQYTARQIRLAFLMHQWNGPLDFSQTVMDSACSLDKKINDFISRINFFVHSKSSPTNTKPHAEHEKELYHSFESFFNSSFVTTSSHVHTAICDNIDTPQVILLLKSLMSATFIYLSKKNESDLSQYLLHSIVDYIQSIFFTFGADFNCDPLLTVSDNSNSDLCLKLAQATADFRASIRNFAISSPSNNKPLLEMCDKFRDISLFELGIKVEDKCFNQPSTVIITTNENLLKEREELKRVQESKTKALEAEKERQNKILVEKSSKALIPPSQMFLKDIDKYSAFDEKGLPTHDFKGNPLSKTALKKLLKKYQQQTLLYEKNQISNS